MGCTPLAAQDRRDYVDDDDVIVICKDRNIANSKIRIYEHARSCAAIVNTFLRQRWYFMELCQGRQRKDERRNDTIDFVSRALNFHFTFARLLNAAPAGLDTCTSHQIELSVFRSMHLSTKLVRSSRILRCAMVVADYVNDNVIVPDKMLAHLYVRF